MLATAKRLPRAAPALLRGAARRLAAPARADSNVPFATSLNASLAETDPQLFDIVEQEKVLKTEEEKYFRPTRGLDFFGRCAGGVHDVRCA